jgi:hypothetical protein
MKHVFIAVGGSGTKVAEALVRLLAIGFPTRSDGGALTSAGDKLEIWRVDPDRSSGAVEDLKACLLEYGKLQASLGDGSGANSVASSRWAMDIETNVRDLDPLELPKVDGMDNEVKTLRGILDSRYKDTKSFAPMLSPFYETKDLDVEIDRGFYQKPFIGAAVMSVFSRSLEDDSTPAGKKAGLTAFSNTPTNFYLCGSLHGGTGACGVPVMAQFLHKRKTENPSWGWRVGGCLLAPFVKPPMPPFGALQENQILEDVDINSYVERFGNEPAFQEMTTEEKHELVKQILLGFYADPDDMEARARQGLTYYKDHSADYFDELYLVGKPNPNQLKTWSNGGKSQKNPLNSADFVAALAALNFFAQANTGNQHSYIIGSSLTDVPQENMQLRHLPTYRVQGEAIEAEKVVLATALTSYLVLRQMPWGKIHESAKDFTLAAYYDARPAQKDADLAFYEESFRLISNSLLTLVKPHSEQIPTGWAGDVSQEIWRYLSPEQNVVNEIQGKMGKRLLSKEAKGANTLGETQVKFTTFDYGKWCPEGDQFTRGEYMRRVWQEVYRRCQKQLGN